MQGIGSQLSKNVLGMKFMRKTKDELEKSLIEEKHRHHFTPTAPVSASTPSNSDSNTLETVIQEVRSYGQVIGFRFGRVSFGGFNRVVEDNVEKGKWKPVHVHPATDEDSDLEPPNPKRSRKQNVKDVKEDDSEDEEEPVYGSLIATCGKQFLKKAKEEYDDSQGEEDVPLPAKKRGGWVNRGFRSGNYNKEHGDSRQLDKTYRNKKTGKPPKKKAKFMKPRND